MLLEYVARGVKVTDDLKYYAEKKMSKIDRYFDKDIKGSITFEEVRNEKIVEVTINLPGTIIRAEESTSDFHASIDLAVDALERQVRKYKTRLQKRYRNTETIRFEHIEDLDSDKEKEKEGQIVKTKSFYLNPMSPEEALLQMELLGHNFFIFMDGDTGKVNVVYRRKDNNYGLIEAKN